MNKKVTICSCGELLDNDSLDCPECLGSVEMDWCEIDLDAQTDPEHLKPRRYVGDDDLLSSPTQHTPPPIHDNPYAGYLCQRCGKIEYINKLQTWNKLCKTCEIKTVASCPCLLPKCVIL